MQFHRIVCVIEGAEKGHEAARRAAFLADQLGAHLTLVSAINPAIWSSVAGPDTPYMAAASPRVIQSLKSTTAESLSSLADDLAERHAIGVSTKLVSGPTEALLDFIDAHASDLVVVGGEHSGMISRLLQLDRGTARTLTRRAPCPVVVCSGAPQAVLVKHAVVGVDLSPAAAQALEVAASVVGSDGRLSIVHVVSEADEFGPRRQLEVFSRSAGRRVAGVDTYIDTGKPADILIERAEEIAADAIFVGSHPPIGLGERVFGTVADRLVAASNLPVFAIPHVDDGEAAVSATDESGKTRIDRTIDQTFPASDPPSWWAG